jgi:SAM-dependent methyltransferase
MQINKTFEELIDEGERVEVTGWDFSWFEGRATEERPPWGYQRLVAERLPHVQEAVDLQTGGGEVFAGALTMSGARPSTVAATEEWEPNLVLARAALAPWHGQVFHCGNDEVMLPDHSSELVVSRHPVTTPWAEISRVLRPGGRFLSQQVGNGTVRELTAAMIGPFEPGDGRKPEKVRAIAEAAGLETVRIEHASLPMTFNDIAAVVVFLRKVIWTVPNFSVAEYLPQLRTLHERIQADGPFGATSERFLIECRQR